MPKRLYRRVSSNERHLKKLKVVEPDMVTLGSDCSGLDTAAIAAKQIGLRAAVEFASEVDPRTRQLLIKQGHRPRVLFHDVMLRSPEAVPPVQIYTCGFPCQPVSTQGLHRGAKDPRSKVLRSVFRYIKKQKPAVVVLENVKGLLMKKHRPA